MAGVLTDTDTRAGERKGRGCRRVPEVASRAYCMTRVWVSNSAVGKKYIQSVKLRIEIILGCLR